MTDIAVPVTRLPHGAALPLPAYATPHAAGLDLHAALGERDEVTIEPGAWTAVPTGIAIALPEGFEAQIRPRSGLARRHGLTLLNAPGTIDADYRGEIEVLLINHGPEPVTLLRGDRIAQMVVSPVARIAWAEVEELAPTARGSGGFGSTGVRRKEAGP